MSYKSLCGSDKNMKLKEIDLTKGKEHKHPDIKCDKTHYVADWDGHLILGQFSEVWFGLTFNWFWGASSLQFDAPGYNSSSWKKLWEVIDYEPNPETVCKKCGTPYTSLGYCLHC